MNHHGPPPSKPAGHQHPRQAAHKIGQMLFSDLRSRSYFTLGGAVRRYLKHYREELKFRQVHINRWK